jgi:cation transporter-like permease
MEKIIKSISITVCILLVSIIIIAPIVNKIGYSSAEGSYHLVTHCILLSLIFTVIYCTLTILEEITSIKEEIHNDKSIVKSIE